eukprot:CAMPEP_0114426428 /NCGR_PEP_ID=MMETSP0103-20121206/7795_1 /TAXON_ID=37642 ORGANISM="Paraphysomonas imperforata, Strain PA2" /NCGR_SAMPLE_ID=MMETSP0103 /ASSEMBLY_ACC=CAM_ASM_000201 /LENGTH=113 /DNA_ID=CAMNT_0001595393 /DNA_START=181 /DNA_END=518 /DNA_ORIENTATION=+
MVDSMASQRAHRKAHQRETQKEHKSVVMMAHVMVDWRGEKWAHQSGDKLDVQWVPQKAGAMGRQRGQRLEAPMALQWVLQSAEHLAKTCACTSASTSSHILRSSGLWPKPPLT